MSSPPDSKSCVTLIGMPGCGKSTLAPMIAQQLGYDYLDVDYWICERTSRDMPYLAAEGDDFILSLQERCIREANMERLVVSTPGSIIYTRYLQILKDSSQIVYLEAPPSVLQQRIDEQDNPQRVILSGGLDLEELYMQRDPLYRELADVSLEYQQEEPSESIARILAMVK